MIQRDRKSELVEIAYRLIAQNGLEGFRIRQVAAEAGIDNGTLHYHFPSKEALILGVVDYLMEDLTNSRAVWKGGEQTALDELRLEFEDIRLRLHRTPEQFIVLSDLAVRSWRDPVVAKIFSKVDDGWHAHLVAILERGIQQGIFRNNLNVPLCAKAMMVSLRGIGYQSRLPRRKVDELLSELAAQTERWITAVDAPQ
ncbi:MAG: TetR/AcrR family transcriptional regulator [Verrucomicrobia bacterium]|nr:TetR/AcrR family transcriptional regulator [Verrucomicrobiota bacterium]